MSLLKFQQHQFQTSASALVVSVIHLTNNLLRTRNLALTVLSEDISANRLVHK